MRFCPTETLAQGVPFFDAVPLDVDVTLPATGNGPFPAIVMLHGWGANETAFEATSPSGNGNATYDYNNIYCAEHGFAVLDYSARGWGNSCGSEESREGTPACKEGFIRIADMHGKRSGWKRRWSSAKWTGLQRTTADTKNRNGRNRAESNPVIREGCDRGSCGRRLYLTKIQWKELRGLC